MTCLVPLIAAVDKKQLRSTDRLACREDVIDLRMLWYVPNVLFQYPVTNLISLSSSRRSRSRLHPRLQAFDSGRRRQCLEISRPRHGQVPWTPSQHPYHVGVAYKPALRQSAPPPLQGAGWERNFFSRGVNHSAVFFGEQPDNEMKNIRAEAPQSLPPRAQSVVVGAGDVGDTVWSGARQT